MYIRWRVMGFSYARGASSFNATSFSRSRTPALIVGRSPWIAAHALVGLSWLSKGLILRAKSGSRGTRADRSEEHTSELQSLRHLVCRLLLEKKRHLSNRHRKTLRSTRSFALHLEDDS